MHGTIQWIGINRVSLACQTNHGELRNVLAVWNAAPEAGNQKVGILEWSVTVNMIADAAGFRNLLDFG